MAPARRSRRTRKKPPEIDPAKVEDEPEEEEEPESQADDASAPETTGSKASTASQRRSKRTRKPAPRKAQPSKRKQRRRSNSSDEKQQQQQEEDPEESSSDEEAIAAKVRRRQTKRKKGSDDDDQDEDSVHPPSTAHTHSQSSDDDEDSSDNEPLSLKLKRKRQQMEQQKKKQGRTRRKKDAPSSEGEDQSESEPTKKPLSAAASSATDTADEKTDAADDDAEEQPVETVKSKRTRKPRAPRRSANSSARSSGDEGDADEPPPRKRRQRRRTVKEDKKPSEKGSAPPSATEDNDDTSDNDDEGKKKQELAEKNPTEEADNSKEGGEPGDDGDGNDNDEGPEETTASPDETEAAENDEATSMDVEPESSKVEDKEESEKDTESTPEVSAETENVDETPKDKLPPTAQKESSGKEEEKEPERPRTQTEEAMNEESTQHDKEDKPAEEEVPEKSQEGAQKADTEAGDVSVDHADADIDEDEKQTPKDSTESPVSENPENDNKETDEAPVTKEADDEPTDVVQVSKVNKSEVAAVSAPSHEVTPANNQGDEESSTVSPETGNAGVDQEEGSTEKQDDSQEKNDHDTPMETEPSKEDNEVPDTEVKDSAPDVSPDIESKESVPPTESVTLEEWTAEQNEAPPPDTTESEPKDKTSDAQGDVESVQEVYQEDTKPADVEVTLGKETEGVEANSRTTEDSGDAEMADTTDEAATAPEADSPESEGIQANRSPSASVPEMSAPASEELSEKPQGKDLTKEVASASTGGNVPQEVSEPARQDSNDAPPSQSSPSKNADEDTSRMQPVEAKESSENAPEAGDATSASNENAEVSTHADAKEGSQDDDDKEKGKPPLDTNLSAPVNEPTQVDAVSPRVVQDEGAAASTKLSNNGPTAMPDSGKEPVSATDVGSKGDSAGVAPNEFEEAKMELDETDGDHEQFHDAHMDLPTPVTTQPTQDGTMDVQKEPDAKGEGKSAPVVAMPSTECDSGNPPSQTRDTLPEPSVHVDLTKNHSLPPAVSSNAPEKTSEDAEAQRSAPPVERQHPSESKETQTASLHTSDDQPDPNGENTNQSMTPENGKQAADAIEVLAQSETKVPSATPAETDATELADEDSGHATPEELVEEPSESENEYPISFNLGYEVIFTPKDNEPTPSLPLGLCKYMERDTGINRVKSLLYAVGSRVHRGRSFERKFAEYWDALSLRLSDSLSRHTSERCDKAIHTFLKTRKLRKIHNQFILSLMKLALRKEKEAVNVKLELDEDVKMTDAEPMLESAGDDPTKSLFVASSGAVYSEVWCDETPDMDLLENERRRQKTAQSSKPAYPSTNIPGALVVDLLMRQLTEKNGIRPSELAVWMMVVAVKEHTTSVLKAAITQKEAIDEGELPERGTCFPRALANASKTPPRKELDGVRSSSARGKTQKKLSTFDVYNGSCLMSAGSAVSLGGCISRESVESCLHASFDNLPATPRDDFAQVQQFLVDQISEESRMRTVPPDRDSSDDHVDPKESAPSTATAMQENAKPEDKISVTEPVAAPVPTSTPAEVPAPAPQAVPTSHHPMLGLAQPPKAHVAPSDVKSPVSTPVPAPAPLPVPTQVPAPVPVPVPAPTNPPPPQKSTATPMTATASVPTAPATAPVQPPASSNSATPGTTTSTNPTSAQPVDHPQHHRGLGRGAKNLAAMLKRSTPAPAPAPTAPTPATAPVAPAQVADAESSAPTPTDAPKAETSQPNTSEEKLDPNTPTESEAAALSAQRRGKGFNLQMLAAMRARATAGPTAAAPSTTSAAPAPTPSPAAPTTSTGKAEEKPNSDSQS
eukprot:Nitzschia sp. Nitz4//scaffold30_size153850//87771//93167//NITZ4_002784-RA/size153850-processed-gene-0.15-mRNA-1//1//CDS//3329547282//6425//frame0